MLEYFFADTEWKCHTKDVPLIEFVADLLLFNTCVAVHVLALHICDDLEAGAAEIVYP